MSERQAGWYWVMFVGSWNAAEWVGDECQYWQVAGMEGSVPESCFDEVGPRIPTPDEMERQKLAWQAEALESLAAADRTWRKAEILAAARAIKPRPGGGE